MSVDGGQCEREQLGPGARLGAGPWRPCRVLSGSQEGCFVSLFVPEEVLWGVAQKTPCKEPYPGQMGR